MGSIANHHTIDNKVTDSHRTLVERVASSRYFNKSARLHDLLMYVCGRVLDDDVQEIGEQEIGCNVFERPRDYDTATDNIARVHASLLRKRLEQYFEEEGRDEPIIIEIVKGNYAPVFRARPAAAVPMPSPATAPGATPVAQPTIPLRSNWKSWIAVILAAMFGCFSTLAVLHFIRPAQPIPVPSSAPAPRPPLRPSLQERMLAPTVNQFWSQILVPEGAGTTDVVLDDSALELYQQMLHKPVSLEDYLDGNYMHKADKMPAVAKVDRDFAESMALKGSSSNATIQFFWTLSRMSQFFSAHTVVRFPKEYSRRRLQMFNAIMLGNGNSNPWIQLFDKQVGLRWKYDGASESYYPVDTWATGAEQDQYRIPKQNGNEEESYAIIALLPSPGKKGNVAIISCMSPQDYSSTGDFLTFEDYMWKFRWRLQQNGDIARSAGKNSFPYFEALLRITRRPMAPADISVVTYRAPRLQEEIPPK
ncbi:MAG TPA: hypothetical protein VK738_04115 [Terriglobales bacterium]|jgi:hypothetical protein|nr:hypothetical protein [Terriglobales bacterium]